MAEKILIIDDTPANMSILVDLLEPQGYHVSAAPDGIMGLTAAARLIPDMILLDVLMPGIDGLETCRRLKADPLTAHIPVLFISARDDSAAILEGFRAGGADFVVKPFQPEEVLARISAHLRLAALTRELTAKNAALTRANEQLQSEITRRRTTEDALHSADQRLIRIADHEARRWGIEQFIGKSATLMKILATIRRLQNFSTIGVLITGESGTGKELVARAIHHGTHATDGQPRGPFVPVNAMAIPEADAEATFFGTIGSAATPDRKGCFELADGGTLFLDEIGDMPASLQTKLLRVLEDGQVTPLGPSTPRKVNVRVLAATNADLEEKMAAGTFRRDLFFRLAQFHVHVPPLRQRRPDIPLLARPFIKVFAPDMGLKAPALTTDALEHLENYDFPGNVRELKNIIERALIESAGTDITADHLQLSNWTPVPVLADPPDPVPLKSADPQLPLNLDKAESLLIERALAQTGGNVARAARLLGINRSRIYRKFEAKKNEV